MRPKVFIPQVTQRVIKRKGQVLIDEGGSKIYEPAHDFTPAAKYGDLEVLIQHNKPVLLTVPIIRILRRKLQNFSDNDFIIATGDPSLMMITAGVAAQMNRGRFTLLKWDRRASSYIPIIVDLNGDLS